MLVARKQIGDAGKEVARLRDGEEVIVHRVIGAVPFDQEALLAALGVIGQRAIGEAVAIDRVAVARDGVVDRVNDAGGHEQPQWEKGKSIEDGHEQVVARNLMTEDGRDLGWEHLPSVDGSPCASENVCSLAESQAVVVDLPAAAGGRLIPRAVDEVVRERLAGLAGEIIADLGDGGLVKKEHGVVTAESAAS